ncbi:MAG: type VI secretion system tip protein TssI/VgrG [Polyangiaceae bacterium]
MNVRRTTIRLESPDFELVEELHVVTLEGEEAIGEPFWFELEVELRRNEGRLDVEDVRGGRVAIVFEEDDVLVRKIWGVIPWVTDRMNPNQRWRRYAIRVEPRLHWLSLIHASDVLLDITVPDAIADKVGRMLPTDAFEMRLHADYPERELIIQYQETDLAFVSRLAEHLGIGFFFEHGDTVEEGDKIVFADSVESYPELPEPITYRRQFGRGLHELESTTSMVVERCVVKDYNYRTPTVELTASAEVQDGYGGGYYEYAGHHQDPAQTERLATIRAEEMRSRETVYRGESDRMALSAGHVVTIEEHADLADTRQLITRVHHAVRLRKARGDEEVREVERGYENSFVAIPADRVFRPARVTPKPKMAGYFAGLIEPEDDAVIGASAKIDDWGRYWVRFLFDIEPRDGHSSKPIRMAQPHAGAGHGMHFPLRPGVEVAIGFANGDPDRPIILGALPNPVSPSPTVAKNSRHNILNSASGIRITVRDTL